MKVLSLLSLLFLSTVWATEFQNNDVKEYGGFITATKKITESKNLIFGGGFAHIENKQSESPFAINATGQITTPGILENNVIRLAYEYKILPELSWISEGTKFNTTNKISSSSTKTENAQTIETGILMKF